MCFLTVHNESNSVRRMWGSTSGLLFQPGAYITHNETLPLGDSTGGNL